LGRLSPEAFAQRRMEYLPTERDLSVRAEWDATT
jgi:hypothetical protein